MSAEIAQPRIEQRAHASARARVVLGIGPLTCVAGIVWALLQPWRLTLLHPHGQGFWWLFSEPPLYVLLAGLVFRLVIAPGIVADLETACPESPSAAPPAAKRRAAASSVAGIGELFTLPASLHRLLFARRSLAGEFPGTPESEP